MTKDFLAKLGIVIDEDEIADDKAQELIDKKFKEMNANSESQKNLLSKRNSEIAEYKRKEQEKLSDDEKTKLHYQEVEERNKTLERRIALSEKVAEYVSIGYDADLAKKVAEAELDGKSTVSYHKQFISAREEKLKAELLKGNPTPEVKGDPKTLTKADLDKMGYEELMKVQQEKPELYNEWANSKNDK